MFTVRDAEIEDAQRLLEIYSWYVVNTAVSFDYDPPSLEEYRQKIVDVKQKYPFLVPAGKGGDFKPFREAGKNGVFRFLIRHGGQHHRLEMGPGKINAQLRHGAGVVRFAVHQAVEPGIAQHRAALLQESEIVNQSRYRAKALPAAGALLKEEDLGFPSLALG